MTMLIKVMNHEEVYALMQNTKHPCVVLFPSFGSPYFFFLSLSCS